MKDFYINFYKVMVHRISPWGKAMMTVICQMWGKFTPDRGQSQKAKISQSEKLEYANFAATKAPVSIISAP